ncbi:hypothetical protein [Thalassotalea fusca]
MDFIDDLLPAAYAMRSEVLAKDKRQQPKANKRKQYKSVNQDVVETTTARQKDSWDSEERRSGEDRRQKKLNRGRFLESREEKDRRQLANALFLKI